MKKFKIAVAALLMAGASLTLSSCVGSFALTNKVLTWNKGIGNKFVNELVFIAFWILPVYEVTALSDLLVVNSIEFWSGNNPLSASTKIIDTDNGRYLVDCDGKGYTVTYEVSGESFRLDFCEDTRTWSVETAEGESVPFMTFVDDTHVLLPSYDGKMIPVETSAEGLTAYKCATGTLPMACR